MITFSNWNYIALSLVQRSISCIRSWSSGEIWLEAPIGGTSFRCHDNYSSSNSGLTSKCLCVR